MRTFYLQDKALNLLGNAANFMSTQLWSGSVDPDLVRSVGTSLFSGIGNILGAASGEAKTNNEETEGDEVSGNEADRKMVKEKVRYEFILWCLYDNIHSHGYLSLKKLELSEDIELTTS